MTAVANNLLIGFNPGRFGQLSIGDFFQRGTNTGSSDTFVSSSEEGERPVEEPSFWTRLVQSVVNTGRRAWRVMREFNPFTQAFNLCEDMRVRSYVQEAQNRNGLGTEEYHRSLQYTSGQNNENALFRYHHSNSNKDLIVLVLGNSQTFDTDCGINTLAERFHRAGHSVIVLRTGQAAHSLRNRFFLSNDFRLHTDVVYAHDRNIINDIRNRTGIFSGLRSQQAHLIGFSFGGGTVINYTNETCNESGLPIRSVACIDPVRLGHYHLAQPEIRTPGNCSPKRPYLQVVQNESYLVNGENINSNNPGITSVNIPECTHSSIAENQSVQDRIFDFVKGKS